MLTAGLLAWSPVGPRAGAAPSSPAPLFVYGEGTWDVAAEYVNWHNGLYNSTKANGAVNDEYIANGEGDGTGDFLSGAADYLISGVPLQPAQVAKLPGRNVIAAPIMPSGLGFLLATPRGCAGCAGYGGFSVDKTDASGNVTAVPYGPTTVVPGYTPGQNGNPAVYYGAALPYGSPVPGCPATGCPPVNVPNLNLAAMLTGDHGAGPVGLDQWANPDVLATWDQTALNYDPGAGDTFNPGPGPQGTFDTTSPDFAVRADPNDDNYYLQAWALSKAPSVWTGEAKLNGPSSLIFPPTFAGSGIIGIGLQELLGAFQTNAYSPSGNGLLTYTPPSGVYLLDQLETSQPPSITNISTIGQFIGIENANGDHVAPSPGSIESGVAAGAYAGKSACESTNNDALFAMTNKVPGAYPLSWMDCLYAPAKGLSIAKADAIAGLIRYLITDGQAQLESYGDAQLPSAYFTQAINAANQLVTSNCPSAGGQVVLTATPPVYAPTDSGVENLGPVDECVPVPPAPKTTTTIPAAKRTGGQGPLPTGPGPSTTIATVPPTATQPSNNTPGQTATPSTTQPNGSGRTSSRQASSKESRLAAAASTGPPVQSPGSSSTPSPPATGRGSSLVASVAANLPWPLGSSGQQGIDKLTALLLGGALFLLARAGFRRVRRALRA
jgi:hypothetical protein